MKKRQSPVSGLLGGLSDVVLVGPVRTEQTVCLEGVYT